MKVGELAAELVDPLALLKVASWEVHLVARMAFLMADQTAVATVVD